MKPPQKIPKMTKAHYEFLAWWLLHVGLAEHVVLNLAKSLARELKGTNPNFDAERFVSAATGLCGHIYTGPGGIKKTCHLLANHTTVHV